MQLSYKDIESGNGLFKSIKTLFSFRWDIDTVEQLETLQVKLDNEIKQYQRERDNLVSKYAVPVNGVLEFETEMKRNKFNERITSLMSRNIDIGEKIQVKKETLRTHGIIFSSDEYIELKKIVDFI